MTYEDFGIAFEWRRKTEDGDRYFAQVWHSRLLVTGGLFTPKGDDFVQASKIQEVQHEYLALIDCFHQCADTLPERSFDQSDLLDLGRRVTRLLPDPTQASLIEAAARARHRGQPMRLIIAVDQNAKALLSVPWELLVLPLSLEDRSDDNDDFLLQDARFVLVRQVLGVGCISPSSFDRPLRFQSFMAQPHHVAPIQTEAIKLELAEHTEDISACWYDGPSTLEHMQLRLLQHTPQILHLLCHGSENDVQIKARHDLLLTHSDGYIRRASIYDLAPVLSLDPDLRLVLLQACYGGAATIEQERRVSESIALGLLRRGIPFVIAFQGEVAQQPAAAFVDELFRALSEGRSVEQAVARGRAAMIVAEGVVDWSLPVIYSGQALPEPRTPLHRVSIVLDLMLRHPSGIHTVRSFVIALAICLIVAGLVRWIFFPDAPAPSIPTQFPAILALWVSVGWTCPAVIAIMHQGIPRYLVTEDKANLRKAMLLAQWIGAYMGYAFGTIIGLVLLGVAYLVGILSLVPNTLQFVPVIPVLFWSLLLSYTITRWAAGNTLTNFQEDSSYTAKFVGLVVIFACFMILGLPAALAGHVHFGNILFTHPPVIALTMGLSLIAMVLLLERA